MQEWKKFGEILVGKGVLSQKTADRVLKISQAHNRRLGWTLEKLGLATGEEVAEALSIQHGLKMLSHLADYPCCRQALDLVSYETAVQSLIFPLKLERGNLLLAIADPTNMKIVHNLAANSGLQVIPCVAARDEIYSAICRNYLNREVESPVRETVLVVEDEETTQESVRYFLAKSRYSVLVAGDGLQGFNMTVSGRPQVILTDKVMPKLDGFALLESLKAIPEFESVPVILMSDKLSETEEMRVFDMGFFDYVPKPISMTTLVSRVKRAFRFSRQKFGFF